jgi:uncharacterized membrane protein YidH (DUF202 family)
MRKVQIVKLRILGCFLILLGIFLAGGTWLFSRKTRHIESTGVPAVAIFLKQSHETDVRGARNHYLEIEYPLADGKTIRKTLQAPEEVVAKASREGDLKIKYDPENPEEFVFVDFPYTTEDRYIAAVVLVLLGVVLCFFAFARKISAEISNGNADPPTSTSVIGEPL